MASLQARQSQIAHYELVSDQRTQQVNLLIATDKPWPVNERQQLILPWVDNLPTLYWEVPRTTL
jgi:hypothetical protein